MRECRRSGSTYSFYHIHSKELAMRRSLFLKLLISSLVMAVVAVAIAPATSASHNRVKVVVDADIGVDDAAAIAYLLSLPRSQVDLLGITAVAGNTSVENS